MDTVSYPVEEWRRILAVFFNRRDKFGMRIGEKGELLLGNGERMEYENIIFRLSMLMGDNGDAFTGLHVFFETDRSGRQNRHKKSINGPDTKKSLYRIK